MGLTSMTGFGRAEVALPPNGRAIVEIQTLNHRFLEMECRLPNGFQDLEEPVRSLLGRSIRRGRVRVSAIVKTDSVNPPFVFNPEVARRYLAQIRSLQRRLRVPGEITLPMVLSLPQVITTAEREDSPVRWGPLLKVGLQEALQKLVRMRQREGQRLEKALAQLVVALENLARRIRRRLPVAEKALERRWAVRVRRLALQATHRESVPQREWLDTKSLLAEAAAIVQASDVTEELTRLDSHLMALRRLLKKPAENPGRTVDFLAQELHREVNTLGAKVQDSQVTEWVVAMKGAIEKVREQAANIE